MMRIPALLYGTVGDVRKRCRGAVTRYIRGQDRFLDTLSAEGMVDTVDHPGLIVVDGSSPAAFAGMNYHCDLPLYLLLADQKNGPLTPT